MSEKLSIEDKLKKISEFLGAGGCFVVFYVPTVEAIQGTEKAAETAQKPQGAPSEPAPSGGAPTDAKAARITPQQKRAILNLCQVKEADCEEYTSKASAARTTDIDKLTSDEAAECIKTLSAL